jgi:hypothetical protein
MCVGWGGVGVPTPKENATGMEENAMEMKENTIGMEEI